MEDKINYGGRRHGAGRPKTKERIVAYISIELAEELKKIENKSEFISNAIKLAFEKEKDTI